MQHLHCKGGSRCVPAMAWFVNYSSSPCCCSCAVQTSGYNLAHNLAMSLFGGFVPMAISALAIRLPPAALSAGVVLVITAVITWAAAVPLIKLAPQINTRAPVGGF